MIVARPAVGLPGRRNAPHPLASNASLPSPPKTAVSAVVLFKTMVFPESTTSRKHVRVCCRWGRGNMAAAVRTQLRYGSRQAKTNRSTRISSSRHDGGD
eukprot:10947463-Lingulodinium_polyedra.AAC.1